MVTAGAAGAMVASIHCDSPWLAAVCATAACFGVHLQLASWWGVVAEISGKHVGAVFGLVNSMGIPGAFGSPIFKDFVPADDSLLVERLRHAGAIVVGKTNTPEFGAGSQTFNPVFGATLNPHDRTRTCGGRTLLWPALTRWSPWSKRAL